MRAILVGITRENVLSSCAALVALGFSPCACLEIVIATIRAKETK